MSTQCCVEYVTPPYIRYYIDGFCFIFLLLLSLFLERDLQLGAILSCWYFILTVSFFPNQTRLGRFLSQIFYRPGGIKCGLLVQKLNSELPVVRLVYQTRITHPGLLAAMPQHTYVRTYVLVAMPRGMPSRSHFKVRPLRHRKRQN